MAPRHEPELQDALADTSRATDTSRAMEEILRQAHKAAADFHIAYPPASNALELYMSVLELDSSNRSANDAIRELFVVALDQVDAAINSRRYAQAEAMLTLLRRVKPDSESALVLFDKLSAKRKAER